jgi:hypothetical protein
MFKLFLTVCAALTASSASVAAQALVRVEPVNPSVSRQLQEQTSRAAIRDYLQSWEVLGAALEQDRADLLEPAFVGSAKDTLTATIQQQAALGIRTQYQDRSHDIQIVFYSPEGLSLELIDHVVYDIQLLDHGKATTTQRVNTQYIIVLTPAEVRWRVRVFQSTPK